MDLERAEELKGHSFKLVPKDVEEARRLAKLHLGHGSASKLVRDLLKKFISDYQKIEPLHKDQKTLDI